VAETLGTMVTSFAQADASEILAADANSSKNAVFLAKRGKGSFRQYLKTSDCRYRSTKLMSHLGVDAGGLITFAENDRTKNLRRLFAPQDSCKVGCRVDASIERYSRILSGDFPRARKKSKNSATNSGVKNSGFCCTLSHHSQNNFHFLSYATTVECA
jgi:hypothetical protein